MFMNSYKMLACGDESPKLVPYVCTIIRQYLFHEADEQTLLMLYTSKWTPPRKAGGIPRVSTRFSLSEENEQADAGRDDLTCLARTNFQARTGIGK